MKKPTIKQLEKMSACYDGIEWYKSVKSKSVESIVDDANYNQLRFCNWYIASTLSNDIKIRYAIYAAEKVLHIFETKYPDDDRPRKAIQAAKDYFAGKIDAADAARAASAAARAAAYAADAAVAAADAAYAAARAADAAVAAADAAYAAADSAYAAARAAYAAAYVDALRDIVKHGISLLEEQ